MKKFIVTGLLSAASLLCRADNDFQSGLEVFLARHTGKVAGKRVGLVTNNTGIDRNGRRTVDIFARDKRINLTALFAPEHGIRGDMPAGKHLPDGRDPVTKLPVFSLYGGRDHRPPAAGLAKIDVLIYHIQDIGSRPYTYIWHLAECMSAAAEAGKTVIVLDVPNIFAGARPDGPVRRERYKSFIGLYPVPYTYGMTVGELARYLNRTQNIRCKLLVAKMSEYGRNTTFRDTKLPWVATSPNVPTIESAWGFPVTGGIGTLGMFHIGLGSPYPFQVVAAPSLDAEAMAGHMNKLGLSGIRFHAYTETRNQTTYRGVRFEVTDPARLRPVECAVYLLSYLKKHAREFKFNAGKINSAEGFDKAFGTDMIRKRIQRGDKPSAIIAAYQAELKKFEQAVEQYLIYQ